VLITNSQKLVNSKFKLLTMLSSWSERTTHLVC